MYQWRCQCAVVFRCMLSAFVDSRFRKNAEFGPGAGLLRSCLTSLSVASSRWVLERVIPKPGPLKSCIKAADMAGTATGAASLAGGCCVERARLERRYAQLARCAHIAKLLPLIRYRSYSGEYFVPPDHARHRPSWPPRPQSPSSSAPPSLLPSFYVLTRRNCRHVLVASWRLLWRRSPPLGAAAGPMQALKHI